MACRAWWSARWKVERLATCVAVSPSLKATLPAMSRDRFGELQEVGVLLRLAGEVLPRGVARERLPFLDMVGGQVVDLGALCRVDLDELIVVLLCGIEGEVLELQADVGDDLLLLRRERLERRLRHDQRLEDEPER